MNGPKDSNDEETELPEEEDIDEEEEDEELGEEEEEEEERLKKDEIKVDGIGFFSFLVFVLVVFFLLISFWQATYPFIPVTAYNIFGSNIGYNVVLYDKLAFYILYGVGFGCLLIGLWRYKYEYWLIILVAILGTMVFFMFFY
ncbi:MAG: hypothetical protein HWN67_16935 [Candidatus Helarchaeota archaeon]|nr:hypothetical protein [Candidatus Helarchaeota archaeon]